MRQTVQRRPHLSLGVWCRWGVLWLVCLLVLSACAPTLKEARQHRQAGRHQQALRAYRTIAQPGGSQQALQAQLAVVQLVSKLERWGELPSEGTRLASFLDPEDNWTKAHPPSSAVYKRGASQISQTLLTYGRIALTKARKQGEPVAYVAAGRLFGLYVERFPRGNARVEAAAGRGVALAIRGDCRAANRLFARAVSWTRQTQSKTTPSVRRMLLRGSLGCQVKLWQQKRARLIEEVADGKRKPKQGKAMSDAFFKEVLKQGQELLQLAPKEGAVDLIQHARLLRRGGAFAGALQLLLLVVDGSPFPSAVQAAKQRALRVFGSTRNWSPLIKPLKARLIKVPSSKRDLFWRRVQSLVVLHGIREAQLLVQANKPKQAAQMMDTIYKEAPLTKEMLQSFYKGALVLEEQKQFVVAAKIFRSLFERFPKHRIAPMALYRHADVMKKLGRLPIAARAFELLANSYPKLKVAPRVYIPARALYESFHCYRRMGAFVRARRIARWLSRRYPRALSTVRLRIDLKRMGGLPKGRRRRRRWRRRRRRGRRRRRRRRRRRKRSTMRTPSRHSSHQVRLASARSTIRPSLSQAHQERHHER